MRHKGNRQPGSAVSKKTGTLLLFFCRLHGTKMFWNPQNIIPRRSSGSVPWGMFAGQCRTGLEVAVLAVAAAATTAAAAAGGDGGAGADDDDDGAVVDTVCNAVVDACVDAVVAAVIDMGVDVDVDVDEDVDVDVWWLWWSSPQSLTRAKDQKSLVCQRARSPEPCCSLKEGVMFAQACSFAKVTRCHGGVRFAR